MTLNEYIMNPFPNGVISAQSREMTRNMYLDKFNKTMLREAGKQFPARMFKGKSSWYLHIKVPSEAIPDFRYDVVIEFLQVKNTLKLEDCEVKFYSNDPAFVFTYANTFKNHKMFVNDLESKMSKEALKTKAHQTNPSIIIGYVKSIYFAYLMCKKYNYLNRPVFESKARGYSKKELLSGIESADIKIVQRQEAAAEIAKRKRIERGRQEVHNRTAVTNILNPEVQTGRKTPRNITSTKISKVIGSSNRSKIVKTVKKTKRI